MAARRRSVRCAINRVELPTLSAGAKITKIDQQLVAAELGCSNGECSQEARMIENKAAETCGSGRQLK